MEAPRRSVVMRSVRSSRLADGRNALPRHPDSLTVWFAAAWQMVAIAVEQDGRALGRCRMQVVDDATTATLRPFLLDHVQPGAVVITDGLPSYRPACGGEYTTSPSRFRFNRRRSRAHGMLFWRLIEHAVQAPPRTYRSLVVDSGSGRNSPPPPPPHKRVRPASLAAEPLDRPWRHRSAGAADES